MKMSEKIIKIREHLNINQSELARMLHMGRAAVNKWENEETVPSNPALLSLCAVLQINPRWLIDDDLEADMFVEFNLFDKLTESYELQDTEIEFLKSYLSANHEKRQAINSVVKFD